MYGVKMGFKKYFSEIDNSIAFSSELNDNYTLYYVSSIYDTEIDVFKMELKFPPF